MANARSGASSAEQLAVSSIADFKARMGGTMELPSGLVGKFKNPGGLQAFIANGSIPNSLLSIVQKQLNGGKTEDALQQAREIAKDLDSLSDMMRLMDIVVAGVFVEPKVYPTPSKEDVERWNILNPSSPVSTPDELRDDDKMYTDDIEELDRQFLFQWVTGGTRDLEKFRKQHEASMAALSASEGSKPAAKSTPRAKKG